MKATGKPRVSKGRVSVHRLVPDPSILPDEETLKPCGAQNGRHLVGTKAISCRARYYVPINNSDHYHYESKGYRLKWYIGSKGQPVRDYRYPIPVRVEDILPHSDYKIHYKCLGCNQTYCKRIKDIVKGCCRVCGLARGGANRRTTVDDAEKVLCELHGLDSLRILELERRQKRNSRGIDIYITLEKPCPKRCVITQAYSSLKKAFKRCECDGFAWQHLEITIRNCLKGIPLVYKSGSRREKDNYSFFDCYLKKAGLIYEIKGEARVCIERRQGVDTRLAQTRKHMRHAQELGAEYRVLVNDPVSVVRRFGLDEALYLGWEKWPKSLGSVLDRCRDIRKRPSHYYTKPHSDVDDLVQREYIKLCRGFDHGFIMNDFLLMRIGFPFSLDRVLSAFGLPPTATVAQLAEKSGLLCKPARGRNVQAYLINGKMMTQKEAGRRLGLYPRTLPSYFQSIGQEVVIGGNRVKRLR